MACTLLGLEHKAAIQEGVMKFMPYYKSLERVGTFQKHNTRRITQMMQMNWNVMDSSRKIESKCREAECVEP